MLLQCKRFLHNVSIGITHRLQEGRRVIEALLTHMCHLELLLDNPNCRVIDLILTLGDNGLDIVQVGIFRLQWNFLYWQWFRWSLGIFEDSPVYSFKLLEWLNWAILWYLRLYYALLVEGWKLISWLDDLASDPQSLRLVLLLTSHNIICLVHEHIISQVLLSGALWLLVAAGVVTRLGAQSLPLTHGGSLFTRVDHWDVDTHPSGGLRSPRVLKWMVHVLLSGCDFLLSALSFIQFISFFYCFGNSIIHFLHFFIDFIKNFLSGQGRLLFSGHFIDKKSVFVEVECNWFRHKFVDFRLNR